MPVQIFFAVNYFVAIKNTATSSAVDFTSG